METFHIVHIMETSLPAWKLALCFLKIDAKLPTVVVQHIRDYIDPQLKIRLAQEALDRYYYEVVHPMRCELVGYERIHLKRSKCITKLCKHTNRRVHREMYDRYYTCLDCGHNW